jgi:predicted lipoprotein with Yx(FWY)xxD motif
MRALVTLSCVAVIAAFGLNAEAATKAAKSQPAVATLPLMAPVGVTFSSVVFQINPDSQSAAAADIPLLRSQGVPVFADGRGMTLYTFDKDETPGVSSCVGECAAAWPPFAAPADAKAGGDWSIIARDDASKQWAYKGKPLYTFVKDEKPGEAKGQNLMNVWRAATYDPLMKLSASPGITVRETFAVDGQVLTDPRGMTLYMSDADKTPNISVCNAACARTWIPLAAPRLGVPVGDFSIAERPDGMKQWAYKGKPLYTYAGDVRIGDANGDGVDPAWRQAMVVRYFLPPHVQVRHHPKHGAMLATASGMTLYARDNHRFTLAGGSHDDRNALRGDPNVGRKIGVQGCDGECLGEWAPLKADAASQPWGEWNVVTRPDGSHQWAYRGFPLYSHVGDKTPGDAIGHDIYQLTSGNNGLFWRVALP